MDEYRGDLAKGNSEQLCTAGARVSPVKTATCNSAQTQGGDQITEGA